MRHIRVVVCEVEEGDESGREVACFDFPTVDVRTLQPATAFDVLEATTQETGNAVLRRVLQARWDVEAAAVTAEYRHRFSP